MMFPSVNLGRHLTASRALLIRKPVQGALAVAAGATFLSILLAADASPSAWVWMRIILIVALGAGAVLLFVLAQAANVDDEDRQHRLIVAAVLITIAIALNLTFTLGATLAFSIGITIVALLAASDRVLRSSWLVTSFLIAAIPFWVWSALQALTWRLLLLIPLAAIAIVTHGHMRSAMGSDIEPRSPLSRRAHRLAVWTGVLGSGLLVLIAGALTSASYGAILLAAAVAIVFVALDAGVPRTPSTSSQAPAALADVAIVLIALCWIVGL